MIKRRVLFFSASKHFVSDETSERASFSAIFVSRRSKSKLDDAHNKNKNSTNSVKFNKDQ